MPKPNAIICNNYRTSFFSGTVCRNPFTQPKGMSYAAWQKNLKRFFRSCLRKRSTLKHACKDSKPLLDKLNSEFEKKTK